MSDIPVADLLLVEAPKKFTVSGWGRTSRTGEFPDDLKVADMHFAQNYKLTNVDVNQEFVMVAVHKDRVSTCTGDKGGNNIFVNIIVSVLYAFIYS